MSKLDQIQTIITDSVAGLVDYAGSVTVQYLDKNNKEIIIRDHNTGSAGLFTAVTRALAGLTIADFIPTSVMGYYVDGNNVQHEAFTQKINYYSSPTLYRKEGTSITRTDSGNNNIVEYTFMVPINNLTQTTSAITALKLFNELNQECASVSLTTQIETNISSSILINWRLYFKDTNTQE